MNIKFARDIEPITTKATSMGILEIIADDAKKEGVKEGLKEGIKEAKVEFVNNLLQNTDFSIEKIASLANVPKSFVARVKAS